MDAEKKAQLQAHARSIATLLYEETDPEQVKTLEGIEATVRGHLLEYVGPEIVFFNRNQSWGHDWTKTHHRQPHRSIECE